MHRVSCQQALFHIENKQYYLSDKVVSHHDDDAYASTVRVVRSATLRLQSDVSASQKTIIETVQIRR